MLLVDDQEVEPEMREDFRVGGRSTADPGAIDAFASG